MEYTLMMGALLAASAVIFLSLESPISMGGLLLVYAALGAVYMGLTGITFWFSYIMFLVFLGGVLILFVYVASLAPNSKYSFSVVSMVVAVCFIGLGLLLAVYDSSITTNYSPLYSGWDSSSLLAIQELYSEGAVMGSGYMMVYLLLALIVVVKMVTSSGGALRALV